MARTAACRSPAGPDPAYPLIADGPPDTLRKTFTPAGAGRASLVRADGARLTFDWDPGTLPWLGVWITLGGWKAREHIALKPTTAPDDQLQRS